MYTLFIWIFLCIFFLLTNTLEHQDKAKCYVLFDQDWQHVWGTCGSDGITSEISILKTRASILDAHWHPPLSSHGSVWGKQAVILWAAQWRGPCPEGLRPCASSQLRSDGVYTQPREGAGSGFFSSQWAWSWQPWPTAQMQPHQRPWARTTQLSHF